MRPWIVAAAALAATFAAAASARVDPAFWISQHFVGAAELGMTRAEYREALGQPATTSLLEGGLRRLEYRKRKLEIYVHRTRDAGIGVLTWDRAYRTSVGIGPCSPVADLHRAYGVRISPFRHRGKVVAYRLGKLTFAVEGGKRVGVVMLADPELPVFTALNAPECGTPGA